MNQSIYNDDSYPLFDMYHNQYQTLIQESYRSKLKVNPIKKVHPSKYQHHAFSTQLCQKLKAIKRKQQFERLKKLQQIQIMKKNEPPTSIKRNCHAFSTQLYNKLKGANISF